MNESLINATLLGPTACAVDTAGHVYYAEDDPMGRIREIVWEAGMVRTVPIYDSLSHPSGIWINTIGDLYIADTYHKRILLQPGNGSKALTVAGDPWTDQADIDGGPSTQALLRTPVGICGDTAGDVFIADAVSRVRILHTHARTIGTLAGIAEKMGSTGDGGPATAALLNKPSACAVDTVGDVYISEGYRIRKVSRNAGTIATVAGTGNFGVMTGDGGPAIEANLGRASGLWIDSASVLYVAVEYDTLFGWITAVRRVGTDANHTIITLVGDGYKDVTKQARAPTATIRRGYPVIQNGKGFCGDSGGNLYITTLTKIVRLYNASHPVIAPPTLAPSMAPHSNLRGQPSLPIVTTAPIVFPVRPIDVNNAYLSIALPVYVPASVNFSFLPHTMPTSVTSVIVNGPRGCFVDTAGRLIYSERQDASVRRVDWRKGIVETIGGRINGPQGIWGNSLGDIYVSSWDQPQIMLITNNNTMVSFAGQYRKSGFAGDGGPATSALLYNAHNVCGDTMGNVFIVDQSNQRIRLVDRATNIISTFAGNGVAEYNGDGMLATNASLRFPASCTVNRKGDVFIADMHNLRVRKVSRVTGWIETFAGNGGRFESGGGHGPATAAAIGKVKAVWLDPWENLFVLSQYSLSAVYRRYNFTSKTYYMEEIALSSPFKDMTRLQRVNAADGTISVVAGGGQVYINRTNMPVYGRSAQLHTAMDICGDASGSIYLVMNRLMKVQDGTRPSFMPTAVPTTLAPHTALRGPESDAFTPSPPTANLRVGLSNETYPTVGPHFNLRLVNPPPTMLPSSSRPTLSPKPTGAPHNSLRLQFPLFAANILPATSPPTPSKLLNDGLKAAHTPSPPEENMQSWNLLVLVVPVLVLLLMLWAMGCGRRLLGILRNRRLN